MTKLAYFMAFAFLLCPCLKASDEQEESPIARMPYSKKGTVFENQSYTLYKEVFEGENARITHRPASSTLCLASIEFLHPNVIVHNNYFTKKSATDAIKSFNLTPNTHTLCIDAPNTDRVSSTVYAKIPVPLNATASEIEILIFDVKDALTRADYAQTIAHGLEYILCSYIPAAYHNGTVSSLKTIVIRDRSQSLAEILRHEDSPVGTALSAQYDLPNFTCEGAPYWSLSYAFKATRT
ncbi:MAG: hypothetical protein H2057_06435 [Alphaproteobacteria bacterium]|nr:hypothetical protein [Alphaproteobacteria bacterium]